MELLSFNDLEIYVDKSRAASAAFVLVYRPKTAKNDSKTTFLLRNSEKSGTFALENVWAFRNLVNS